MELSPKIAIKPHTQHLFPFRIYCFGQSMEAHIQIISFQFKEGSMKDIPLQGKILDRPCKLFLFLSTNARLLTNRGSATYSSLGENIESHLQIISFRFNKHPSPLAYDNATCLAVGQFIESHLQIIFFIAANIYHLQYATSRLQTSFHFNKLPSPLANDNATYLALR